MCSADVSAHGLCDTLFIYPLSMGIILLRTMCPAPRWLDSSVGRTLHMYRRGHGFESRSGLNFFQACRESEDSHEKSIFLLFGQNIPLGELIQGKIV